MKAIAISLAWFATIIVCGLAISGGAQMVGLGVAALATMALVIYFKVR